MNRLFSWVVTSDTSRLCYNEMGNVQYFGDLGSYCKEILTAIFFRAFIILTIAASISCFRSSSTLLRVSFRSGSDSPLAATVWILTLQKWMFYSWQSSWFEEENLLMEFRHEGIVHVEHIRRLDVFRLGCSNQQPLLLFAHRQWLQRPDQILTGDVRFLLNLVVRQTFPVVV